MPNLPKEGDDVRDLFAKIYTKFHPKFFIWQIFAGVRFGSLGARVRKGAKATAFIPLSDLLKRNHNVKGGVKRRRPPDHLPAWSGGQQLVALDPSPPHLLSDYHIFAISKTKESTPHPLSNPV